MPADAGPVRSRGATIAWSIAYLVLGFLGTAALVQAAVSVSTPLADVAHESLVVSSLLQAGAGLLVFGGLTLLVGRRLLRLDRSELGWASPRVGLRGFGWGLALGALVATLAFLLDAGLAGGRWMPDGESVAAYPGRVAGLAMVLLPAAFLEEVAFRGVALAGITRSTSAGTGILITSTLFAGAHALNPGVTPLAMGNIGLAGLFLGLTFFARGGLWTATGAHLGWNLMLAALGAPVSGLPFEVPGIDFAPGQPAWLTGGNFGPEGGLVATVALALGIALAARSVPKGER
ncbi:MAG: lysostaphin resistance A-like protein [Gemmatimonadales bacterium]